MIAYKIFKKIGENLYSLIIDGIYRVKYNRDEVNIKSRNRGGFACFESIKDLVGFIIHFGFKNTEFPMAVYKVDIIKNRKHVLYLPYVSKKHLPYGTVVAKELTILEEIDIQEEIKCYTR